MPQPTVLIVDDEPLVLSIASMILTRAGFRALSAESGEEALALCSQHPDPIRLAVLDIVMPGMDGIELRDRLCERYPDLVAVYMSGYSHADIAARGVPLGPGALLHKPFQPSALVDRVRAALREGGEIGIACG